MFNLFKKPQIDNRTTKTEIFTLAGVTFDNRQDLIKHLAFKEELNIIKHQYEGENAYKVVKLNGEQIGSIRKSDIPAIESMINNIKIVKVSNTSTFVNEDGETIFSCQIGVTYYG